MGLSSSKKTSTNTPVYAPQMEAAAANVTTAFNAQQPKITAMSDMIGSTAPGILQRYTAGDSTVNAAKSYTDKVLGGSYLGSNPYLEQFVTNSNDQVRNGLAASLGTRGLTGGSAFGDIMTRGIAKNTTDLYMQNYDAERGRMSQAAALAPSLSAAQDIPLESLLKVAQSQQMPIQSAGAAGSAVGGLLGSYTKNTQSYTPSVFDMFMQTLAAGQNAAKAAAKGGM